jgi:histidine ammonia-lyase
MSQVFYITDKLFLEDIASIINEDKKIEFSKETKERIIKSRNYLDQKLETEEKPIYGINTGFGSLYNKSISKKDLGTLQENLIKSHACGTGEEIPRHIVKLMLLLKAQSVGYGYSGVRLETAERLLYFYNNDIIPVVYSQGSLGASGDLAPLAHTMLPLIGLGEVWYKGEKISASELYKHIDIEPLRLVSKEGLALLNGTQFMLAYSVWNLIEAIKLLDAADVIGALSLDAFDGRIEPFLPPIHKARPHKGQQIVAERFRKLLEGSEMIKREKVHVQDPYSFRTVPQVHGASRDAIEYVKNVVLTEVNSATDNPMIFPDEDMIISGGNFHGQPLALAMDMLAIAMSEIANISERRIYKLISGQRNLPSFLVANPGLNSGFMIAQYTAASVVSQNKQLSTPASVDSIESSQGQEDHVSMGANASTKAYKVVNNVATVLGIELFTASQAMFFRKEKTSPVLENLLNSFRKDVPFVENDTIMYEKIHKAVSFVKKYDWSGVIK